MNKAINSEYRTDNGTYISPVQKILYTSAKNNTGIQELRDAITEIFSKKPDVNHVNNTKNQKGEKAKGCCHQSDHSDHSPKIKIMHAAFPPSSDKE